MKTACALVIQLQTKRAMLSWITAITQNKFWRISPRECANTIREVFYLNRKIFVTIIFAVTAAVLTARLAVLIGDSEIAAVSAQRGIYTLKSAGEYAGIYDCDQSY